MTKTRSQSTEELSSAKARALFPRGLCQPDPGFRFSMDALLLACFAGIKANDVVGDLGTGCGVVGLGLLLRHCEQAIHVVGIDVDEDMIRAVQTNVNTMGYCRQMKVLHGDVRMLNQIIGPECMDVIVCNPPYRQTGRGKSCPHPSRNRARFETGATLGDFMAGAGFMLKNRGRVYLVYLAEQLDLLCRAMHASRLMPKRILSVHARSGEPAHLVLVEGRKNGGQGLVLEAPLFLYQRGENRTRLSAQALAFCPFLGCNAG